MKGPVRVATLVAAALVVAAVLVFVGVVHVARSGHNEGVGLALFTLALVAFLVALATSDVRRAAKLGGAAALVLSIGFVAWVAFVFLTVPIAPDGVGIDWTRLPSDTANATAVNATDLPAQLWASVQGGAASGSVRLSDADGAKLSHLLVSGGVTQRNGQWLFRVGDVVIGLTYEPEP